MNRPLLLFFVVVLAIVIAVARYNSKKTGLAQAPKPSPSPALVAKPNLLIPPPATSPAPSAAVAKSTPVPDFKKSAGKVAPSVVTLSVFDGPGRLLRNGTGFFVSADGKLATSRSVINEGGHAVAKTADGKIYNVDGILMQDPATDVAIVQVEVKDDVPFIALDKAGGFNPGKSVALVSGNADEPQKENVSVSTLGPHQSKNLGDWSELGAQVPTESLGSPVINENGNLVGVATLERGDGAALTVVRATSSLSPLLTHIDKHTKAAWMVASNEPPPPAAGPSPKLKPSPSPVAYPPGTKKLTFAPRPKYPSQARGTFQSRGSGRYRISFGKDGAVHSVQVIESTHSQILDVSAVTALRTWKAVPGTEWSAEVPLTFSPWGRFGAWRLPPSNIAAEVWA